MGKYDEEIKRLDMENKKLSRELKELMKETFRGIAELRKETSGIGDSNGKFAETFFYNSLKTSRRFAGQYFEIIYSGLYGDREMADGSYIRGEYDVTMSNGDTIVLIEIKYKVLKKDVRDFVNNKVGNFKMIFPRWSNHKFYLGVAGMSFGKGAEEEALKNGVGILRPKGESVEILDENLKIY